MMDSVEKSTILVICHRYELLNLIYFLNVNSLYNFMPNKWLLYCVSAFSGEVTN
jgi:hypothetical protein